MQILFYIPGPFLSNFITQMNNFDNLIEKFSDYFITSAHVYGHYFLCVCWCCSIVGISVYANCPIYYFINQLYIDWLTNQYFRGINIHFLSKNNKKKQPKKTPKSPAPHSVRLHMEILHPHSPCLIFTWHLLRNHLFEIPWFLYKRSNTTHSKLPPDDRTAEYPPAAFPNPFAQTPFNSV